MRIASHEGCDRKSNGIYEEGEGHVPPFHGVPGRPGGPDFRCAPRHPPRRCRAARRGRGRVDAYRGCTTCCRCGTWQAPDRIIWTTRSCGSGWSCETGMRITGCATFSAAASPAPSHNVAWGRAGRRSSTTSSAGCRRWQGTRRDRRDAPVGGTSPLTGRRSCPTSAGASRQRPAAVSVSGRRRSSVR